MGNNLRNITTATIPPHLRRLMPQEAPKVKLAPPAEVVDGKAEDALQREVITFLDQHCGDGYCVGYAQTCKRSTYTPGWPDLTICVNGKFLGIELKTAAGKLSKDQEECHARLRRTGARVEVCRSLLDVVNVVKEMEK